MLKFGSVFGRCFVIDFPEGSAEIIGIRKAYLISNLRNCGITSDHKINGFLKPQHDDEPFR
jgi:hypothetical protein